MSVKHSSCPNCGAQAGSGFFCDECGGPLFEDASSSNRADNTAGDTVPVAASPYPVGPPSFPGIPQPQGPGYPPPAGPGYPPRPAYYMPQRQVPQGLKVSRNALLAVAIPFAVLMIVALLVLFVWKPFEAPKMIVPLPEGWTDSAGFTRDSVEDSIEDVAKGTGLDAMYENTEETYDFIIAMHMNMKGAEGVPPGGADLAEMEKFLEESGDELESGFLAGFAMGMGDSDIESIEAEEMGNGDGVIHITAANSTPLSADYMAMHILFSPRRTPLIWSCSSVRPTPRPKRPWNSSSRT